jgi:hypothetical protein
MSGVRGFRPHPYHADLKNSPFMACGNEFTLSPIQNRATLLDRVFMQAFALKPNPEHAPSFIGPLLISSANVGSAFPMVPDWFSLRGVFHSHEKISAAHDG